MGTVADTREYLTLDEGLNAGLVAVREKGARQGQDRAEVNSLEIENRSDKWLFLQSGDIVKGGKQDRTIMTDLTLPPHSQPTPIDAFCVERGRWTARDSSAVFGKNTGIAGGVALKRAIQGEKSQTRVWEEVAKADAKATDAVRAIDAAYAPAPGSAALSSSGTYNAIVENPALQGNRTAFVKALLPHLQKDKSAIGVAVAINGEIVSADVYASPALFQKLSRKLLDSVRDGGDALARTGVAGGRARQGSGTRIPVEPGRRQQQVGETRLVNAPANGRRQQDGAVPGTPIRSRSGAGNRPRRSSSTRTI